MSTSKGTFVAVLITACLALASTPGTPRALPASVPDCRELWFNWTDARQELYREMLRAAIGAAGAYHGSGWSGTEAAREYNERWNTQVNAEAAVIACLFD